MSGRVQLVLQQLAWAVCELQGQPSARAYLGQGRSQQPQAVQGSVALPVVLSCRQLQQCLCRLRLRLQAANHSRRGMRQVSLPAGWGVQGGDGQDAEQATAVAAAIGCVAELVRVPQPLHPLAAEHPCSWWRVEGGSQRQHSRGAGEVEGCTEGLGHGALEAGGGWNRFANQRRQTGQLSRCCAEQQMVQQSGQRLPQGGQGVEGQRQQRH